MMDSDLLSHFAALLQQCHTTEIPIYGESCSSMDLYAVIYTVLVQWKLQLASLDLLLC